MSSNTEPLIHPSALISSEAEIDSSVSIGAYTIVEGHVKIGAGSNIGAHCVIGAPPQDLSYGGEPTSVEIGKNVTIREFNTVHRGTIKQGEGKTIISDGCYLMVYSHVAHDCILHEDVILGNNVALGGHIEVFPKAILNAFFAGHQGIKIGTLAFTIAQAAIQHHIPPYVIIEHKSSRILRVNTVGMQRAGISKEAISKVKNAYDLFKKRPNKEVLETIAADIEDCPELKLVHDFYQNVDGPVVSFMSRGK